MYSRSNTLSSDPFIRRMTVLGLICAALILLWKILPIIESQFVPAEAPARTVTARGDLAADEKNTIDIFEKSRDSVVYISTSSLVQDFWTRDVFTVPKGTGSGFIWDEAGHVVTNFHVIDGANEATVKLVDGRQFCGKLMQTFQTSSNLIVKPLP